AKSDSALTLEHVAEHEGALELSASLISAGQGDCSLVKDRQVSVCTDTRVAGSSVDARRSCVHGDTGKSAEVIGAVSGQQDEVDAAADIDRKSILKVRNTIREVSEVLLHLLHVDAEGRKLSLERGSHLAKISDVLCLEVVQIVLKRGDRSLQVVELLSGDSASSALIL